MAKFTDYVCDECGRAFRVFGPEDGSQVYCPSCQELVDDEEVDLEDEEDGGTDDEEEDPEEDEERLRSRRR